MGGVQAPEDLIGVLGLAPAVAGLGRDAVGGLRTVELLRGVGKGLVEDGQHLHFLGLSSSSLLLLTQTSQYQESNKGPQVKSEDFFDSSTEKGIGIELWMGRLWYLYELGKDDIVSRRTKEDKVSCVDKGTAPVTSKPTAVKLLLKLQRNLEQTKLFQVLNTS